MCYIIAKRFKKSGCIALKAKRGKELADFATNLQKKLGYDIQIVAITRPTAYGEYELIILLIVLKNLVNKQVYYSITSNLRIAFLM